MSKVTLSLIATSLLLAATSAWLARELAAERAKHAGIESVMPAPASLPSASTDAPSGPLPVLAAPAHSGTEADSRFAGSNTIPFTDLDESTPAWAAAQRLRNSSMRASAKREYTDFVVLEGLSAEDANKFFATLAQDEYAVLLMSIGGTLDTSVPEWNSAMEAKLAKELGEERMSHLLAYLDASPGRRLVEQLEEQLDGRDLPLSAVQRQRLLRAVVREHEQFKALDAAPDEPESWAAIATRRVSLFDHLQLVSQPILSADQMQAVVDFREATGTLPR